MARFFSSFIFLLISFAFVLQISQAATNTTSKSMIHPMGGEGSLKPQECAGKCDFRCSVTQHRKPCLFFCNKCCNKCLCVPSGTYGNKEECPCYNNWKTKEGGPKCP